MLIHFYQLARERAFAKSPYQETIGVESELISENDVIQSSPAVSHPIKRRQLMSQASISN